MRTRMTFTAWSQGVANMLVCAVGVLGMWLTIRWLMSLISGRSLAESSGIAFAVFWIGCLVALVGGWVLGLSRRGALLLDCGEHPTRWLFLANAVFCFVAGATGSVFFNDHLGQWGALFAFSFAAYWVLMGAGRLGIHEHGVWTYWGLLQWNHIKKYSWTDDGTLIVKTSGLFSYLLRGAIPVPMERVDEFKQQFAQCVSPPQTSEQDARNDRELTR